MKNKNFLQINVTARDIQRGMPNTCSECPIARALRRHGFKGLSVKSRVFSLDFGTAPIEIAMPIQAQRFVEGFDGDRRYKRFVKPFSFEIPAQEVQ